MDFLKTLHLHCVENALNSNVLQHMFYAIFSYTATYLHDGLPDYSHYSASFFGHISSDVLIDSLPEALIPMFICIV